MKNQLTDRQKEILDFIKEYLGFNGYPPTLREIAKQFNIASTFGIKRHLDALQKKGYLSVESFASRAISLTENPTEKNQQNNSVEIPVVGRVAAGYPLMSEENIEGSISIQSGLLKNKSEIFGLKVKGESMKNAGIFEGDIIIVNQQKDAVNGDIVVALLDNEATVKRFSNKNNQITLMPENENYNPIEVNNSDEFSIIGKVMGVFRWFN
ncbi:MAG: transcriptional repressor LexA [Ignavibacteriales bacterium CG_4_9_14_3_um_filter_34_10]|nr:MAG: transcriptional repressor LexA [Ignavibacteriales bacterium CG_4_9_14_3_um_filter_34_10]